MNPTPAWCSNVLAAARIVHGESVIVASDDALRSEADLLLKALGSIGARGELYLLPPESLGEEAPVELLELVAGTDVWIGMWERPRRLTAANRQLLETLRGAGARILGMPLVDRRLLAAVDGARELKVGGRAGTNLTLDLEGESWQSDALPLEAGKLANYPNGEIFVLPRSASGSVVADITVPYVSTKQLERPIALTFDEGRITSIVGGAEASALRELIAEAGPQADRVAELGIGINPTLAPRGHVLIDEKIAGTAHVGIGNNVHMGGDQLASLHVDCVFWASDLLVDGRAVELPRRAG